MVVFADTSALFASLVSNDSHHGDGISLMRGLLEREDAIVTSSLVLSETMSLLQARVGLSHAILFHETLRPFLQVVWVDERLYESAVRRLRLRGRRKVSLVDASSFVIMEERGIDTAFAFDDHFRLEGFQLLARARKS